MKRIGVAFPGDPSQKATWSGIPSSLMGGLETAGVEPVPIGIEPPAALLAAGTNAVAAAYVRPRRDLRTAIKNARQAARASASLATVTSWAVPGALRRAGGLDGVIQIGTGYTLRAMPRW